MKKAPVLSKLLTKKQKAKADGDKERLEKLQIDLLRIQQGLWHSKGRAIIAFEGFDAAGKGGTIRTITENLDPRGVRVHAVGAPDPVEQAKHYLYRFWTKLPAPGTIAIFDRTWYGRLLVEKVEKLAPRIRLEQADEEIRSFEKMLTDDGIHLVKIFLGVSRGEQLKRFEERIGNPYKRWKITEDDIRARAHWHDYVKATDHLLKATHTKNAPWTLIPADDKTRTRIEAMETIRESLCSYSEWMESEAAHYETRAIRRMFNRLKHED